VDRRLAACGTLLGLLAAADAHAAPPPSLAPIRLTRTSTDDGPPSEFLPALPAPPPRKLPPEPAQPPAAPPPPTAPAAEVPLVPLAGPPVVTADAADGGRFWVSADILLWFARNDPLPPLVTGTILAGTGPMAAVTVPTTKTLFGQGRVNGELRPGFRIGFGIGLDPGALNAVEASVFSLERSQDGFNLQQVAFMGIPPTPANRPFLNALTGQTSFLPVNGNGVVGTVGIASRSDLAGYEVNYRRRLFDGDWLRLRGLAGYRYLRLNEQLSIIQNGGNSSLAGLPGGALFLIDDEFTATSSFHGGQFGLETGLHSGRCSLVLVTKAAVGVSPRETNVFGATVVNQGTALAGGLLALPSNMGSRERDGVAFVPELGLNLAYQATPRLRVWLGYSLIYWSEVARPGDLVSVIVNPNQVPALATGAAGGPALPAPLVSDGDFVVQGLNIGLEYRFGGGR
jgi:hypothetical protein